MATWRAASRSTSGGQARPLLWLGQGDGSFSPNSLPWLQGLRSLVTAEVRGLQLMPRNGSLTLA